MISRFAIAASLAMALAACGSSNEPAAQSTETVTSVVTSAPQAVPSDVAPSAAPTAEASVTPTPTPSATPTGKASTSAMQSASTMAAASPPTAFNQCAACHSTTPGKTIIGPSLAGVYGRKAGQVPGFQFSDAMKNSGLVLDAAGLDKFLADPKGTVPGTLMALNGIKDASQRKAIIDYLKTLK